MPTVGDDPIHEAWVVIDASALVALLTDGGEVARWVAHEVAGVALAAPELLPFEAANILRRLELARIIDRTTAALAHQDLIDLPIELVGYRPLAPRTRELRANLTAYDASYVALAEVLEAPLITLDRRLARASGVGCKVRAWVPGGG